MTHGIILVLLWHGMYHHHLEHTRNSAFNVVWRQSHSHHPCQRSYPLWWALCCSPAEEEYLRKQQGRVELNVTKANTSPHSDTCFRPFRCVGVKPGEVEVLVHRAPIWAANWGQTTIVHVSNSPWVGCSHLFQNGWISPVSHPVLNSSKPIVVNRRCVL